MCLFSLSACFFIFFKSEKTCISRFKTSFELDLRDHDFFSRDSLKGTGYALMHYFVPRRKKVLGKHRQAESDRHSIHSTYS